MKKSLLYFFGYAISRLHVFFLLPLLVNFLDKESLGIFEVLSSITMFSTALCVFNLDTCMMSFFNEQCSPEKKSKLFITTISYVLLIGAVVLIFVTLLSQPLSHLIDINSVDASKLIVWSVLSGVFSGLTHLFTVLLRLRFDALKFSLVTIFGPVISLALVYFVIKNYSGVNDVIFAFMLANALTFLFSVGVSKTHFNLVSPELKQWFKPFMKLALPLIPFSISSWMLAFVDRGLIVNTIGLASAGIYGVLVKIAAISGLLLGPFQIVWSPYALEAWDKAETKANFLKIYKYFALATIVSAVGVFLIADRLILIFADVTFVQYAGFLPMLLICNFLNTAYHFPLVSFMKFKKMSGSAWAFLAGALVNIVSNLILIKFFGLPGAIVSNLLGYLVMFLVAGLIEKNISGIGYSYFTTALISTLLSTLGVLCYPAFSGLEWYFKILLGAVALFGTLFCASQMIESFKTDSLEIYSKLKQKLF